MTTSRKVRLKIRNISRKLCYLPRVASWPLTIYSSKTELRICDPVSDALNGCLFHNVTIRTRNHCHPLSEWPPQFIMKTVLLVLYFWPVSWVWWGFFVCLAGWFVLLFPSPCGDLFSDCLVSLRTINAWRWLRANWKPSECYWGAFCLVQEFLRQDFLHRVHADSFLVHQNYRCASHSFLHYKQVGRKVVSVVGFYFLWVPCPPTE